MVGKVNFPISGIIFSASLHRIKRGTRQCYQDLSRWGFGGHFWYHKLNCVGEVYPIFAKITDLDGVMLSEPIDIYSVEFVGVSWCTAAVARAEAFHRFGDQSGFLVLVN